MRPTTYEEAWVMESRKLSNLGADALAAALSDEGTRPDPYTANKSKAYFAGGELPPSHLHSPSADPVRRLAGRAATKAVSRHEQEKSGLVGYAQDRLATVRASLEAFGSGSLAAGTGAAGGAASPRSVTGAAFSSPGSSPEHAHPYAQPHAANCGCASCGARASHRAAAVDTLAHYGDFMAMHTERLHRALAEPNAMHLAQRSGSLPHPHHPQQHQLDEVDAALLAGAYSGGRYTAGSYTAPPAGYNAYSYEYGQGEREEEQEEREGTEEDSDGEAQRLPAYVLRRYSEVAGVREKTLGRVANALAVAGGMGGKRGAKARAASVGRQRVLAASQGGVPPTLKEGTLSQRVLEALKQRVGDAADRAAMREVDPDDDSAPSDPDEAAAELDAAGMPRARRDIDARRVAKAMAHTLRSLGGAAPNAAPEALSARSSGGAAVSTGGRGGSSAGWYLTEVLAGAAAGDAHSEGPDGAVPEGDTPVQLSPSQRLPLSQAQQQRRTTAAASTASSMGSSRRRLTFEDELYAPSSPGGYPAATNSLSREDARLLAAMRSAAGDQQRMGMRATWAPVGSPSAGGAAAAAAAMDALATRISVPAAGLGAAVGASNGGADPGVGNAASSRSFGGVKESWAQRVFERVSQPGGKH
eukprot:XP_001696615.1 predicted protein [Chlamydomonas reinhardtii]